MCTQPGRTASKSVSFVFLWLLFLPTMREKISRHQWILGKCWSECIFFLSWHIPYICFRDYQRYYSLSEAETDALLALTLLLSPDKLNGKVIFQASFRKWKTSGSVFSNAIYLKAISPASRRPMSFFAGCCWTWQGACYFISHSLYNFALSGK